MRRSAAVLGVVVVLTLRASLAAAGGQDPRAAQDAGAAAATPRSGIYLVGAEGTEPRRLAASMTDDIEMGGMAKTILTQGFIKPKQIVRHPGAQSTFVVEDASPVFLFRFSPRVNMRDQAAMMAAMSHHDQDAMPIMAEKAREFSLIRLTVDGESRVIDSGSMRKVKIAITETGPGEFRVAVAEPLEVGEYAFVHTDQRRGGSPMQIWSFSRR